MSSMSKKKLSFAELGDLLRQEWEQGNIDNEVHEYIEAGLIPIHILREQLRWVIEREGDGLLLSMEDGSKLPVLLPIEDDQGDRLAA